MGKHVHELAVTESMLGLVQAEAQKAGASRVTKVCLLPEGVCTINCSQSADCAAGRVCTWRAVVDASGNRTSIRSLCADIVTGAPSGGVCNQDSGCQSGFCHLGTCSEACKATCPIGMSCQASQEPLKAGYTKAIKTCLPAQGITVYDFASRPVTDPAVIPVPENAVSSTVVMQGGDTLYPIVSSLVAPDSTQLISNGGDPLAQPERYYPETQIGTMFLPNTPTWPLQVGPYKYKALLCDDTMTNCDNPPSPTHIYYKLAPGAKQDTGTLTVNFIFNGLAGHACGSLTAATAPSSSAMKKVLANFSMIYAKAGITIGTVNYYDLSRSDLYDINGNDEATLNKLFETSSFLSNRAVNVFLVRSMSPMGLLGVAGGIPGPPIHGTAHSGIVANWDGQCYGVMGNVVPHEVGHYLGLFHNIEADAKGNDDPTHQDAIDDTNTSHNNLMYWNEEGGDEVSAGQGWVMRGSFLVE